MNEFHEQQDAAPSTTRQAGYAGWIALGAVVAGSVGAIVGAARCARPAARERWGTEARLDPTLVTAPHGDKLEPAL